MHLGYRYSSTLHGTVGRMLGRGIQGYTALVAVAERLQYCKVLLPRSLRHAENLKR